MYDHAIHQYLAEMLIGLRSVWHQNASDAEWVFSF